ncbi:hypothetical protein INH39_24655 [Massilia violaceinigra]|uniref:DUF3592 domain-containing protein n=1 Tax=Massilia violaceinigra TaxID=2045208 RepID=A0ABY4A1I1_9BURK|nr:hypothetical protein [Massilia violaceinigra]UOD28611.1 hypothetical protein INH39_24655 [Massilia violaceinigra]
MTIFDGVRRGAVFLAVVLTIISAVIVWEEETNFGFLYEIDRPRQSQGLSAFCDYHVDGSHLLSRETDDGRSYGISLCFKASMSADGRMLVEYLDEGGVIRMGIPHSDEVQKYMRQIGKDFHQTSAEMLAAKDGMDKRRHSQLLSGAAVILVGLLFFWLFMLVVGLLINSMPSLRNIEPSHEE